jgi:hypothetical protein
MFLSYNADSVFAFLSHNTDSIPDLYSVLRIRDPGSFLTSAGSGMNIPDHISESIVTIFFG